MTALKKYQRLEGTALWRADPKQQRREVVVSIGDATLTISDLRDTALTHWSLAAIDRLNPGEMPAIFAPDGDPGETLEFNETERRMIDAIEILRQAVARKRPRPGRLRLASAMAIAAAVGALALFWAPGAMQRQAAAVLPDIKRAEIGDALIGRIERLSGPACTTPEARPALRALARRTGVAAVTVLPGGVQDTLTVPGGTVLINRALVEDHETPDVVAGYLVAERLRAQEPDPIDRLLAYGGAGAALRLLTTGALDAELMDAYAEHLLRQDVADLPLDALIDGFATSRIPSTPYARALDVTGEDVLGLIEADPQAGQPVPTILRDRDWLLLQAICED